MSAILEARGLGRTLPGERPVVLVRDVDLAIEPGAFTTIVGPSGCGKSSLLYLLGLLDRPSEGELLFEEREMSGLSGDERAQVRLERFGFVRAADDVADHPTAPPEEKLALLEQMRASLVGESDAVAQGTALRAVLAERGLSPVHALDQLEAFRRDVTKLRYANWDELIDYCRYSAMPVGRFVLDVHGEPPALWPANDALCAALQVINHLQDCGKDYRELNRVYLPQDALAAAGTGTEALAADRASPALLGAIAALARRTSGLLTAARPFAGAIADSRLALEVDLIQTLAVDLNRLLMTRDPLSQPVHHSKFDVAGLFVKRLPGFALTRLRRPWTSKP